MYMHTLCTELIQCPDITIVNGNVSIKPPDRLFNSMATHDCAAGFALVGDDIRICQENSTWSGEDPKCGK